MNKKIKQLRVKVKSLKKIKGNIFLLALESKHLLKTAVPGNFLHLRIKSAILRRPLSVHKVINGKVYILFRVRGRGTKALSTVKTESYLDVIGPLGQGFDLGGKKKDRTNILVAGGIGVAPLVFLAQELSKLSKDDNLILLGAKNNKEIVCEEEFKSLGFKVKIATENGSRGIKGTVIKLLDKALTRSDKQTYVYACGPKEMFLAINKKLKKRPKIKCEVSFEQFMGCGLGVCCACSIKTKKGYKKTCKDGPVFNIKDIW